MKDRVVAYLEKVTEYSLYALIFFIPISKAAIEIFFGIAFFSLIIRKILKPDFQFLKSFPNLLILVFIFFMALSLFNSGPFLLKSIKALFAKWFEYLTIFILMQESFNSKQKLRNVFWLLMFSATLVGVDGINQKLFNLEFIKNRGMHRINSSTVAISGPFSHYNDLGAYIVGMLSLVLAKLISKGVGLKLRIFFFTLTLVLAVCLFLSFSRGAWLGMALALLCMLILSGRFKELLGLGLLLILTLVSVPVIRERLFFTFKPGGDAARFSIWHSAWLMIKEHPFLGKGLGTFMDYFTLYSPGGLKPQYAHNCYLQIWAESGIFSLVSFIALIAAIFYRAVKIFKGQFDYFALGLICAVSGLLAHGFFDTQLYSLQLATFFWVLLGLLMAEVKTNA